MKKLFVILILVLGLGSSDIAAQCSICTKTAAQMGEEPAKGLNAGIIYLASAPLIIGAAIGYRWWRNNRNGD